MKLKPFGVFAVVWLLVACAHLPRFTVSPHIHGEGPAGACADFFEKMDRATMEAGVRDAGAFRVEGFPYLRINRFLASFEDEVGEGTPFDAWVAGMQELDRDGRVHEISALPEKGRAELLSITAGQSLMDRVVACGDLLKQEDFHRPEERDRLKKKAAAPDDYILPRQIFGLYPFTSIFVYEGVVKLHETVRRSFSLQAPLDWVKVRYAPGSGNGRTNPGEIIGNTRRDALGIPRYSPEALQGLFDFFAPVWEVETRLEDDLIGSPAWKSPHELGVDTGSPVTYTLLSFTRFGGEVLTQLNYIIWFPSRPKKHFLDLYGGFMDGVDFRVTLDTDGRPLLYDIIHNCGCYHEFYPTDRLEARKQTSHKEPPLVLKAPVHHAERHRMVVSLESRTHFVKHLYPESRDGNGEGTIYPMVPYDHLRSLPYKDGRGRSMFEEDSLVLGSYRLERWILWPTGVLSPGAMRQFGRHAVAFVGRRHFDDPDLMENIFTRVGD